MLTLPTPVDARQQQTGHRIANKDQQGAEEHDSHQQGNIAPEPRIHSSLAEPRVGEYLFSQERPTNQLAERGKLQAERRGQGVAQHVKTQHGPAAIPPERGRSG